MKKFFFVSFCTSLFLLGILNLSSCTADEVPEPDQLTLCDTLTVSYDANIKDLLDTNCATPSCHGGTISPNLSNYSQANNSSNRIITRAVEQQTMPPSGSLSNEEIDLLNCWEDAGFPEN